MKSLYFGKKLGVHSNDTMSRHMLQRWHTPENLRPMLESNLRGYDLKRDNYNPKYLGKELWKFRGSRDEKWRRGDGVSCAWFSENFSYATVLYLKKHFQKNKLRIRARHGPTFQIWQNGNLMKSQVGLYFMVQLV